MTRTDAYIVLTKALEKTKQTGAVRILINGISNFGIPRELDDFKKLEIEVNGKRFKLHEFFPTGKLKLTQELFQSTIAELEMHDFFVNKEKTFVLSISRIPPEPPIYIPRYPSNRIVIDKSIFKTDCLDVFIFNKTIERHKLSEIAKPHCTASSNSQLNIITARFIFLDEYQDWIELKKKCTKVPIHLMNYEPDQNLYILEDSTAALEILAKIGSKKQGVYLSEEEFVQQLLSEDLKASSVCICDTPGMGKTFVLANIARHMSKQNTRTIVVFIQLSTFVDDFSVLPYHNTLDQGFVLSNAFKHVSQPFPNLPELLTKLVKAEVIRMEIFFDGFDEIPADKIEWMEQVFLLIKSNLSNVRIYITSRHHMRHWLETSLGVIAYDILPFNLQNQVDYLARFWSPNVAELENASTASYALIYLKEIKKSFRKNDEAMTGIPLLCLLIAEVYANKVHFYSTTGTKNINLPFKIAKMYQNFVEQRINTATLTDDEKNHVQLYHIWAAVKLIFPTEGFHKDKIFANVDQIMATGAVLKIGVIQFKSNSRFEFIHRTFAEFFVAEYCSGKLQSTALKPKTFIRNVFKVSDKTETLFASILNLLLATTKFFNLYENTFVNSVIVCFFDSRINEVTISEKLKSHIALVLASKSSEIFLSILCSCCHHNFYSLFSILKEAVKKWNWYQKKTYFTTRNCFKLLQVCIGESTSQMFHSCIQLLMEVLKLDVEQISIYDRENTLLHIAVKETNYEAVAYLVDIVSLELPNALMNCVKQSYDNDLDM